MTCCICTGRRTNCRIQLFLFLSRIMQQDSAMSCFPLFSDFPVLKFDGCHQTPAFLFLIVPEVVLSMQACIFSVVSLRKWAGECFSALHYSPVFPIFLSCWRSQWKARSLRSMSFPASLRNLSAAGFTNLVQWWKIALHWRVICIGKQRYSKYSS